MIKKFKKLFKNLTRYKNKLLTKLKELMLLINYKKRLKNVVSFIQKKPYTSFLGTLLLFLLLLVVGNLLFAVRPETQQNIEATKKVKIFKLGEAPTITYQGKVEKSGVAKIVAQAPGIVASVNTTEGQWIGKDTSIVSLSSNYQGGNTLTIARQIAQTQYETAQNTYDQQGGIIGQQKDLANKNHDNQVLMQQITQNSITQTQWLSNLNNDIINQLNASIKATPSLQNQEVLSQFMSAQNQTTNALQTLQVQGNQASIDSAQEQHDIAVEQLDIQRKMLDMNLDLSKFQYQIATVNEANMYPATPFSGTVDRIFVHVGEIINPGTTLATISGDDQNVEIIVNVPQDIAKNLSTFEPSTLFIGTKQIKMMPFYVSKDATDGNLYSVIFQLGDSYTDMLSDSQYINVSLAVGTADTTNEVPYIPLDAIIQTQEESFVYVLQNDTARVKKITLGQIQGNYVEVTSGLSKNSEIILDRNVIEGDKVVTAR